MCVEKLNRLPPISAERPSVMARTKYSFQSNLEISEKIQRIDFCCKHHCDYF